ncbi:MAG: hypothetical protein LBH29_00520, partial [Elusimicrobiota bacterium]|nr:hypothetical protein [Elusimicrobiota bacterium]
RLGVICVLRKRIAPSQSAKAPVSLRRKPQSLFIIKCSPLSAVFFSKAKTKAKWIPALAQ